MQTFDWALIQSFLAVADKGSFSAAARSSRLSQPTIGRHIQLLQDQLGTILFRRGGQGYVLTDTGVALMEHALTMREAAAQASLVAEGRTGEISGTVRITASEIMATYILPDVLVTLLKKEPSLQVELVATNSTENLLLREADIAVRMVRPDQQTLIARKIGEINLGLFAAPEYLAEREEPQQIDDLDGHALLGYDRSDLIIRGMAGFGVKIDRDAFAFRTDDQVVYMEALKSGAGIGASQVGIANDAGLTRLFPEIPIEPIPVWLAAHRELRTSARVRRVFDFLTEELPPFLK